MANRDRLTNSNAKSNIPQPVELSQKTENVIIEVGPHDNQYTLSKDFVSQHSEFCRNFFNNDRDEDDEEDRKVTLAQFEPWIFEIFLHWMDEQTFPRTKWEILDAIRYPRHKFPHLGPPHLDPYEIREVVDITCVKMLLLGEFLKANEFTKAVHNHFVDRVFNNQIKVAYGAVIYTYDNFPEGHVFLKLLVEAQYHFHHPDEEVDPEEVALRKELPLEFLLGVMDRSATMRRSIGFTYLPDLERSEFHMHDSDAEKQKCECSGTTT